MMLAGNSPDMRILPNICPLLPANLSLNWLPIIIVARMRYNQVSLSGWLLLRVSGEEKYSFVYDIAMKVHALLPNPQNNVHTQITITLN